MRTASGEPMTNEPKATHTPGPWRVLPTNDCVIESEKHGNIALVNLARMSSADARLIAAAPDLLALAKQYASECSGCNGTGFMSRHIEGRDTQAAQDADDQPCDDCADIRAVIEKAEDRE